MPWLVSIRMRGQVIGARATTATRRSVIFRSEGLELVLVFCRAASRVLSAQKAAPRPAARTLRRLVNFVVAVFMLAILRDILERLLVVSCWMFVKAVSGGRIQTTTNN